MDKVLLVNGPNLNLLGKRQVELYGSQTLEDIVEHLKKIASPSCNLIHFQNNIEGEIVNFLNSEYLDLMEKKRSLIQSPLSPCTRREECCVQKREAAHKRHSNDVQGLNGLCIKGIIINPAAYTHTSIAIRDALEVFYEENVKIYEVHLSNIFKREDYRHKSYFSSIANGVICGLGAFGYEVALNKILHDL